jgi:RNA polymerase sigma-70 factor (ECF subfamily)
MESAFLAVIKQNQRIIHKVSRMYRDTIEDRQDLFQEIVFQLWKSFPNFRQESMAGTWIYRIALNTAIASYRKAKPALRFTDTLPDDASLIDHQPVSENEERMYQALSHLNDSEKSIIALFLEDYSYAEIAEIVGISENYVGVKMSRIKEKLKLIVNGK